MTDNETKVQADARHSQAAHCAAINEAVAKTTDEYDKEMHRTVAAYPDITNTDRIILVLTSSIDSDGEKFLCDWVWPTVEQPWSGENPTPKGVENHNGARSEWWFPHLFPSVTTVIGKDANGFDVEQWVMPLLRGEAAKAYEPIYMARANDTDGAPVI